MERQIQETGRPTLEDAAGKLFISVAPSLSRHPTFFNYLTVDLAVLRGITQELAQLFGLTLPFSLKK